MLEKPIEFWIALIAASLFVYDRSREKPLISRVSIVAISAGLGVSVSPDIAQMAGVSEVLSAVLLTTLGYLVLDFATALFSDREFLKSLIKSRMGKK